MPTALPLSSQISQASQGATTFKTVAVRYGNGYGQRAGDGFNNEQAVWNLSWENLNTTDFGTLTAAFSTSKGTDYFTWTAPGDSASKKWVVASYQRVAAAGSVYTVSASLAQVFDL